MEQTVKINAILNVNVQSEDDIDFSALQQSVLTQLQNSENEFYLDSSESDDMAPWNGTIEVSQVHLVGQA